MAATTNGIPLRARQGWEALQAALDETVTPCRDRDEWISQHAEEREYAVHQCGRCPITALCRGYADAARERDGVWGGVDRTAPRGRPAERQLEIFPAPGTTNRQGDKS